MIVLALMLAQAVPAHGTYRIFGIGNAKCSDWTAIHDTHGDKDVEDAAFYQSAWLSGFVSSYNDFGGAKAGDVTGGGNVDEMEGWISGYCRAHPDLKLGRAAGELILYYERRRALPRK